MTLLIILGIIVVLGIMIASMYNSLVKLRNNRENAFADIDVQLKQRHDLIPQLVDTVKGYASHEKETLDRVIQARNGAINARTIDDKINAENQLTSALTGLKPPASPSLLCLPAFQRIYHLFLRCFLRI